MNWSSGLQFRVVDGQREKDRVIRLDGKELKLGRAQAGQRPAPGEILFREPTVSRVHVSLSWKARKNGFQLTHKSGTNPTLVNGKPTKKILLTKGDRVQMGLLILELEEAPVNAGASGTFSSSSGDGRNRSSMTEPILEALSKVEKQHEEDRRRTRAEREKKQRQRELMASPAHFSEADAPSSRSRRLDEALRAAPPAIEEKKRRRGPTFGWQPPEERDTPGPTPQERQPAGSGGGAGRAPRREPVYELVVIKGPDQGKRFPLQDMVMVLGQRQGHNDERDGQGVLLNDATLPPEIGMFAWQGREGSYGLLASENSMQIIEVDRFEDGLRRRIRVDSQSSILLKIADEIQVGLSTLRVQKIGEPLAAPASHRSRAPAPPPTPRELPIKPAAPPSPAEPESTLSRDRGPTTLRPRQDPGGFGRHSREPAPSGYWGPGSDPAAETPPATGPTRTPETVAPVPEPETPLWAQATLVPGRDGSKAQAPPTTPVPAQRTSPAKPRRSGESLEWGSRPQVDFLFEFMAGPLRGCQVSMSRAELGQPRRYDAGTIGTRKNDIALEGPDIPNAAFHLIAEDGRFSLCSEAPTGLVQVNRSGLKSGDRLVLMTGDLIIIGETQIRFLEREVVKVLSQHALLAESGVTSDQDRIFPLLRQRLTVGRGKSCDIRLADLEVSRLHLGLAYSEGQFSIQHRSETNPTFLNGLSLLAGNVRALKVGDRIRLSSLTVLRFVNLNEL